MLGAALSTSAGVVLADAAQDAIEYRRAVFQLVKWNFAPMGDMVKGKTEFDAERFEVLAQRLAALSEMPLEGFSVEGSDKGDTKARAEIWSQWDDFAAGMQQFEKNAQELASVASSGDLEQIKPAFAAVGKTCKGCHDNFKDK
ncbi:Cytochrome c556 [Allopseudospirillum japonicum]|uniref:Cytochrome c556 n=2 Tax=Allopseudospirillum japonicum TaxID=64971 RepID=A0A1H6TG89_9GAMM|nr:Cytochrome c556 [Allopseudospirillum japonicum]